MLLGELSCWHLCQEFSDTLSYKYDNPFDTYCIAQLLIQRLEGLWLIALPRSTADGSFPAPADPDRSAAPTYGIVQV
jgi:hypothetical protein